MELSGKNQDRRSSEVQKEGFPKDKGKSLVLVQDLCGENLGVLVIIWR